MGSPRWITALQEAQQLNKNDERGLIPTASFGYPFPNLWVRPQIHVYLFPLHVSIKRVVLTTANS